MPLLWLSRSVPSARRSWWIGVAATPAPPSVLEGGEGQREFLCRSEHCFLRRWNCLRLFLAVALLFFRTILRFVPYYARALAPIESLSMLINGVTSLPYFHMHFPCVVVLMLAWLVSLSQLLLTKKNHCPVSCNVNTDSIKIPILSAYTYLFEKINAWYLDESLRSPMITLHTLCKCFYSVWIDFAAGQGDRSRLAPCDQGKDAAQRRGPSTPERTWRPTERETTATGFVRARWGGRRGAGGGVGDKRICGVFRDGMRGKSREVTRRRDRSWAGAEEEEGLFFKTLAYQVFLIRT